MSLHRKHDSGRKASDVLYASSDLSLSVPKHRIPRDERSPRTAYALIHDELLLDGNSRQNLATFCTTWMEPEALTLMNECIDKNMIDKDEYPQTAEIEARCVHILADLWNSPDGVKHHRMFHHRLERSGDARWYRGEMALARETARAGQIHRQAEPGLRTGASVLAQVRPVLRCRSARDPGRRRPAADGPGTGDGTMRRKHDHGRPDARRDDLLSVRAGEGNREALDNLEKNSGLDIPIHVDAASGGFLAPFCQPELVWDFRLPRVKSINTSGHKFGLAPLGVGWVVWRDHADLPEDLVFHVNYLGGNMPTFALNFSRPAGQIICQYYNFLRLGFEGYRRIQNACYHTAQHIAAEIAKMGPFRVIYDGRGGLPAVCWTLKEGSNPGFTLYDFSDRLRARGWQVPAYSMPPNRDDLVVQRILVRHGLSRDLGDLLLEDMRRSIALLEKHPVSHPLTENEAGGYNHN